MKRRRIITSEVEELEPWEQTRERLQSLPRPELERFVHDFVGAGWRVIRSTPKTSLIALIVAEWEANWRTKT
jgi:hypothetical protein